MSERPKCGNEDEDGDGIGGWLAELRQEVFFGFVCVLTNQRVDEARNPNSVERQLCTSMRLEVVQSGL